MNGLRLSLWFCAGFALAACGRSETPDANRYASEGVTVELPPFEPEGNSALPAMENVAESLNVLVPAATEREAAPAEKVEKPEPKPAEPESRASPPANPPAPKPDGPAAEPTPPAKAEETSAPRPAAARMPLSNERVASTIDRIGFPCGSVVSANPVEGASVPTWKIACSSGATYQGTNRSGHMRFRKWQ